MPKLDTKRRRDRAPETPLLREGSDQSAELSPELKEANAILAKYLNLPACQPPQAVAETKGKAAPSPFSKETGTENSDLGCVLFEQAASLVCVKPGMSYDDKKELVYGVAAALRGIAPRDELEGMLAAQMIGAHNLAMEFMHRAIAGPAHSASIDANVTRATKLMRTFTAQIEALNRYRGQGQQKVTVEHVHVNEGGQAIVGVVGEGGRGKRADGK